MTNEELERVMNFIIERQERMSAQQERSVEQQAEHDERIARFERSYVEIANLLRRHDERLGALEESRALLTQLAQHADERLDRTDERLDRTDARSERLEEAFQTIARLRPRAKTSASAHLKASRGYNRKEGGK